MKTVGGIERDDTSGKCFLFPVDTDPQVPPLFVTLPPSFAGVEIQFQIQSLFALPFP